MSQGRVEQEPGVKNRGRRARRRGEGAAIPAASARATLSARSR